MSFVRPTEVFITSSAGGMFAVTEIDGQPIGDGNCGDLTRRIRDEYWRRARLSKVVGCRRLRPSQVRVGGCARVMNTSINEEDAARYDLNSLKGLFALLLVHTIGPQTVIILPGLVQGYVEQLGFSEQEAGFLASVETWGMFVATFAMMVLVSRVNWRTLMGHQSRRNDRGEYRIDFSRRT